MITDTFHRFWGSLPPVIARVTAHLISLAMGIGIAILIHYVLYRVSLPGTPFIYVVF